MFRKIEKNLEASIGLKTASKRFKKIYTAILKILKSSEIFTPFQQFKMP